MISLTLKHIIYGLEFIGKNIFVVVKLSLYSGVVPLLFVSILLFYFYFVSRYVYKYCISISTHDKLLHSGVLFGFCLVLASVLRFIYPYCCILSCGNKYVEFLHRCDAVLELSTRVL